MFCNPGVDGAHEKGGIEGEGGYFRRNHWVPVPQALDLEDLNAQLLAACVADEQRRIAGREITVGQAVLAEKEHLLPLAEDGFDLAEVSFPRVDGMVRVQIRTNFYSVPVRAGLEVQARVYAGSVEIWEEMMASVNRFPDSYYFRPRVVWRIVREALWDSHERQRLYTEAVDFLRLRAERWRYARRTGVA